MEDTTSSLPPQVEARQYLSAHGLTFDDLEDLESRWSCKWTDTWGKGDAQRTRILYQW